MPEPRITQRAERFALPAPECYEAITKEPHEAVAVIRDLLDQRLLLLAACKEFVRKCDAGQAISSRSYKQMKEAISFAEPQ